jgi:hypothetical protein
MSEISAIHDPGAKPQVLAAIPYSRAAVVSTVIFLILVGLFTIVLIIEELRPGGIDPRVVQSSRLPVLVAIVLAGALGAVSRFRAPAFAVLKEGLKLPNNRYPPGRSARDPWAAGFYSWGEVNYCRWSPYQPGVLSVHLAAVESHSPALFGKSSRGPMSMPPEIFFYTVPARHRAAVEAAIRACGKWAD